VATYILAFLASGAVVVAAGSALAHFGEAIAKATGIARIWIGAVLVAAATSLPELTTDIAAVRLDAADLAAGDLFGSSLANMLILAIIDLAPPRHRVLQHVALDHTLAASLAMMLTAVAALLVLLRLDVSFLSIGPGSLLLFLMYVAGTRVVYRQTAPEGVRAQRGNGEESAQKSALRSAAIGFAAASLVVLAAAPVFAWSARGIAAISGLGNTFVGTWLVGLATSLPELVASLAAVRMGSLDLAVGNLFGSNAFNMAIFLPLDIAQPGNIFAALDTAHALSGLFALVLMSLGVAAMVYRARRRFAMIEPDSLVMVLAYFVALYVLFRHSAGPLGG
jgi:cation:H+ antiporter